MGGGRRPQSSYRPLTRPGKHSSSRKEGECSSSDTDNSPPSVIHSKGYNILSRYDAPPPLESDCKVVEELEGILLTLDDTADQEFEVMVKEADKNWIREAELPPVSAVAPLPSPLMPELERVEQRDPELTELFARIPRTDRTGRSVIEVWKP